jgi:hypothetical protein
MHLTHLLERNLRRVIGAHGAIEENYVAAFELFKVTRRSRGCACGMPDGVSTGLARVQVGIFPCFSGSVGRRMGEAPPKIVRLDSFFSGFGKSDNHSEERQHRVIRHLGVVPYVRHI